MPVTHNYNDPSVPFRINGVTDQNAQRFFVRHTLKSHHVYLNQWNLGYV